MVKIGDINNNLQEVLSPSGTVSTTHPNQTVYRLSCQVCGHEYGANGCDVHIRRCPSCQGGRPGEPIPNLNTTSYSTQKFEEGVLVKHNKFGIGVVIGFSNNKVLVKFKDGNEKFIIEEHLSEEDAHTEINDIIKIMNISIDDIYSMRDENEEMKHDISDLLIIINELSCQNKILQKEIENSDLEKSEKEKIILNLKNMTEDLKISADKFKEVKKSSSKRTISGQILRFALFINGWQGDQA